MKPQAFQPGELRDENNNIIREGAYGKKTPFCNAENMGILDYLMNNFDVLYKGLLINGISFDENGTPSLSPEVTLAMENIKKATEAAKDVAVAAKEAAAISAQDAADSATSAFEAANNASTSANNAASSASAASTSASNAAGSASTASTKATSASTSASNAAKSATEAQNSATQASGLVSKAAYGFIQRNKAYAVGDIAYCEQLPAGYYLECVTAGTTGNTEPTFKVGGVKVLDGSVMWDVKAVKNLLDVTVGNVFQPINTINYAHTQKMSVNNGCREMYGGSDERNALFQLVGRDSESFAGMFRLLARNKEQSSELQGTPDGDLSWKGKPLIYIEAMTANCIRYSNGYQECWGNFTSNDGTLTTVNFDLPFKDYNICISLAQVGINGNDAYSNGFRNAGIEPTHMSIQNTTNGTNRCDWSARGWWK